SRVLNQSHTLPPANGLIVPELFSPEVARTFPQLKVQGPRVALFHDAIALKFPELTPPKTVARFPAYLQELLQFDGVAAVSEDSANILRDYWRWLGVSNTPPVQAIPLGITTRPTPVIPPAASKTRLSILCVGT